MGLTKHPDIGVAIGVASQRTGVASNPLATPMDIRVMNC